MLAEKENSDTRNFFSLSKGGMIQERLLPEARGTRCWSSHGWLITIADDLSMFLLNPVTRAQIQLPHQRTFKDNSYRNPRNAKEVFIHRAILSSSPSWSSNYVVMVIHGVVVFDIESPNSTEARIVTKPPDELLGIVYSMLYIVELSGALVVVSRTYVEDDPKGDSEEGEEEEASEEDEDSEVEEDSEEEGEVEEDSEEEGEVEEEEGVMEDDLPRFLNISYQTAGFQVFELDLTSGKWAKLSNLGDKAMFLGHNSSMSVVASDIPGCEANCIYFTDDNFSYYFSHSDGGGKDMGIFNLQDGSIKQHYMGDSRSRLTTPMACVDSNLQPFPFSMIVDLDLELTLSQNISSTFSGGASLTKEEGSGAPALQPVNETKYDGCYADDSRTEDSDLYLSDCRIFLVGFQASEMRKLVNMEVRRHAALGVIYVVRTVWLEDCDREKKEIHLSQRHIAYDLRLPKEIVGNPGIKQGKAPHA
ncbi:hypothetical protein HHK36_026035 [Tetracentron sinense]|uniref:KIB1-4 beta-propeller domain-containing protein n=1 Tax=Tetracentron sinense TaxID=13715 RepID=A0A835D442_TETSI|nr:hypothetical protein HHK36_026035 [Tetracentron sinense]